MTTAIESALRDKCKALVRELNRMHADRDRLKTACEQVLIAVSGYDVDMLAAIVAVKRALNDSTASANAAYLNDRTDHLND